MTWLRLHTHRGSILIYGLPVVTAFVTFSLLPTGCGHALHGTLLCVVQYRCLLHLLRFIPLSSVPRFGMLIIIVHFYSDSSVVARTTVLLRWFVRTPFYQPHPTVPFVTHLVLVCFGWIIYSITTVVTTHTGLLTVTCRYPVDTLHFAVHCYFWTHLRIYHHVLRY